MILLQIIVYSIALYFAAKHLKLADLSYITSIKTSLVIGTLTYILQYQPYMAFFGLFLLIGIIKYFYKIDIKKAIHTWLISLGIMFLILLVATLPYDLYRLYIYLTH